MSLNKVKSARCMSHMACAAIVAEIYLIQHIRKLRKQRNKAVIEVTCGF